jgi:hypothetical protein
MIAVTYPSLFGTTPDRKIGTWDELVEILSDHRENTDKERAPLWSPVTLVPGGTRKNAAVAQVNALVFDVDGGTAYATAKAALADREWIAYSTFSHTPEEERFHLVVRLPDPVSGEAWAKEYDKLRKGIEFGDTLRAPSHSYFLPQHRPGAEYFVEVNR